MGLPLHLISLLLILSFAPLSRGANDSAAGLEFFESKVRPILFENCYKCHSREAERIRGGLRVDSMEAMLAGGDSGPALVKGDPDKSRLVVAVRHTDADLQMPREKMSEDKIKVLEEWVKMGAPYPATVFETGPISKMTISTNFWAARPVQKQTPPSVRNATWVRDPIDAFVLAKLEAKNLEPASHTDKWSLLRRVTFDLTGLPPKPEEIESFIKDDSKDAFTKVVDKLLESEQYGAHWARKWLDAARYADSNGLDQNLPYDNAWRYRDYVVEAFNSDKPYREFIMEQLAGDLLPAKDLADQHENWIATGFLLLGPKNFAEPNRLKLLMDVADEQIDATTRGMLGLTVSCARCHDHKFDPIPTRDYYAMAGIFRSTATLAEAQGRGPQGNNSMWSQRPLGTKEQTEQYETYLTGLTKLEGEVAQARQMLRELPGGIDSRELNGICMDNLAAEVVGSWQLSNYSTNFVDKNYLHDGNERQGKGKKLVRFRPNIPQTGLYEIRLAYTPRLNRATNVPVTVSSPVTNKTVYLNQTVEPRHDKAFEMLGVFELTEGTNNVVEISNEKTKGFVVVDAVQFIPRDVQLAARLMMEKRQPDQPQMMMAGGPITAMDRDNLEYKLMDFRAEAPPTPPMAMAVRDGLAEDVRLHIRGDTDKLGELVPRGFISVLKQGSEPIQLEKAPLITIREKKTSGRLELAEWIAHGDNPLTARVHVNRVWLGLFGKGIVGTPDNFGITGEKPTHPELLDYLATELVENGWSTKKLIRKIILSSTYQMSTEHRSTAASDDPENELLWRMNRKRLSAEQMRDSIMAVSGNLDLTIGGNSLATNNANVPNRPVDQVIREFKRRSIYLPVLRGNVTDVMQVFDFPDPHAISGKRHVTTAAPQALFMMNSPFVLDESGRWAEALKMAGADMNQRIERAYIQAYGRKPNPEEIKLAGNFLINFEGSLLEVETNPEKRQQLALKGFCQALFESTEFRYLN